MPAALKAPRLLSLDAGGERISAALFSEGRCVASAFEEARQRQTERLAPLVQALLEKAQWPAHSLGAIAVGRGPGSFTGLRSSLALAQGLGAAAGARLIGTNTLEAWAEASGLSTVAVALDGRRGQVYFAKYSKEAEGWEANSAPALMDKAEALQGLKDWPLRGDLDPQDIPPGAALAEAVGRLAWARWKGQTGEPLDWEPLYLRRAEVEILWEKLHPKAG